MTAAPTPLAIQVESVAFCARILDRVLPSLVGQGTMTAEEAHQIKLGMDGAERTLGWVQRNATTIKRVHSHG